MVSKTHHYVLAADVVLVIHFAFVAFVVVGLMAVLAGRFLRWTWVRNFWFRVAHLLAISIVAGEALGGIICPLTTWESRLRELAGESGAYPDSFIQHWVHRVMFFEASQSVFTVIYVAFFALVLASFWWVKPRWPARRAACSSET
jgi:hypothetical protein